MSPLDVPVGLVLAVPGLAVIVVGIVLDVLSRCGRG